MCTSFVHRQNGIVIGMNFDNNGMAMRIDATPDAFVVSVDGGFEVLRRTTQSTGEWQTALSMVYVAKEHAVYYCHSGDFAAAEKHAFAPAAKEGPP